MLASPCAPYCPGLPQMDRISELFIRVKADPALYDIGARYLCGRAQNDYDDNEFTNYFGRVGCFIRNMQPESTLAKSPHMTKESVANCGDYSSEWASILQQKNYLVNPNAMSN